MKKQSCLSNVHTHTDDYNYIFMCVHNVCVSIRMLCTCCMYVCTYICMHVCMYVCMHVRMYVCMHVCMHVCMYVRMYVRMYACMYACMCACGCQPLSGGPGNTSCARHVVVCSCVVVVNLFFQNN